jgi:hypothetical protein
MVSPASRPTVTIRGGSSEQTPEDRIRRNRNLKKGSPTTDTFTLLPTIEKIDRSPTV